MLCIYIYIYDTPQLSWLEFSRLVLLQSLQLRELLLQLLAVLLPRHLRLRDGGEVEGGPATRFWSLEVLGLRCWRFIYSI